MSERLTEARYVKRGEKIKRLTEIVDYEKGLVFFQTVEKSSKNQDKSGIATTFTLDMSGKSKEELLLRAARHVVTYDLRKNHFADLSESELIAEFGSTYDATLYESERTVKSDIDKARSAVRKLSEAEFVQLATEEYGQTAKQAIAAYKRLNA